MARLAGPLSVALLAVTCGLATRSVTALRSATLVLATLAVGLVGWAVPEPQGNFVWLALGDRALEFAAAADEIGITVRPFAGDGCRASVAEPEATDRLVALAARYA